MISNCTTKRLLLAAAAYFAGVLPTPLLAQQAEPSSPYPEMIQQTAEGTIITPGSSVSRKEDAGLRAHTNVHIFIPRGQKSLNSTGPYGKYETPASLACVYGVTAPTIGCNPETLKTVAATGSRAIAIVDAYDDPNAAADLGVFSAKFGLPAITSANFEVVYASGKKPAKDSSGGWELEESLDVDMVHALAPNAKIYLVEAANSNLTALLQAEKVAAKLVAAAGGGEVTNSWGCAEFSGEAKYEADFSAAGVVYFASAGDNPGTIFPSTLTNVVGVGGTTILRTNSGTFKNQMTWAETGGGPSHYLSTPAYQSAVAKVVGTVRGVPDIALDANPYSAAWMYDSVPFQGTAPNWVVVGGTSVASPLAAALVNSAGTFNTSSNAELTAIYGAYGNTADFKDITFGTCYNGGESRAKIGWDFCTGVGAPIGFGGK